MARYDVFRGATGGALLLDVQTDLIEHLKTRVVVPLLPAETTPPPISRLHPVFEIDGRRYVMATPLLAAIPGSEIGERLANFDRHHERITAALDMLFQGF